MSEDTCKLSEKEVQHNDAQMEAEIKAVLDHINSIDPSKDEDEDFDFTPILEKAQLHSQLPGYVLYVQSDVEPEWVWGDAEGRAGGTLNSLNLNFKFTYFRKSYAK